MNKILLQSTIVALSLESALQAQTWDFGAGTQAWTDALNWSGDVVPTTGVVNINTATPGETPIITTAVSRTGGDTFIGNGAAGVLDINAGGSTDSSTKWMFIGTGTNGVGTVNVNAGGSMISDNDLRLAHTASSTGNLNINGGTVSVARVVTTGTGNISVSNGGQLTTTSAATTNGSPNISRLTTSSFTAGSLVSSAADVRFAAGNSSVAGGSVTAAGQVLIGDTTTSTLAVSAGTVQSGSWLVVGIGVGGSGTLNLSGGTVNASQTSGFTTVGANNNAVGLITQSGGIWNQTNRLVLGESGTGSGTYTLDDGTLNTPLIEIARGSTTTGTLNVNGGNLHVGQIAAGAGTAIINLDGGTIHATGSNGEFITSTSAVNVTGDIEIDSHEFDVNITTSLVGVGGLDKSGSGSLALGGAANSLGAVTVSAGSLFVNGALGATSINVASGATLGGSGDLTAPINMAAGSTIGAGQAIGTLDVTGNLAVNGIFEVEYEDGASQTIDLINILGQLNIANATLNLENLGGALSGGNYVIATYSTLAGTEFSAITGDVPADYTIDYAFGGNSIALVVVPEPGVSLLGLTGALLLFRRRRN